MALGVTLFDRTSRSWPGCPPTTGSPATTGFSPAIVQEASGIAALGLVAAGPGVTVVAASYRALSLEGVRRCS